MSEQSYLATAFGYTAGDAQEYQRVVSRERAPIWDDMVAQFGDPLPAPPIEWPSTEQATSEPSKDTL